MSAERPGCFAALFPWLFSNPSSASPAEGFPYRLRDDFLSQTEASFFHVLRQAAGEEYLVCPKVSLRDLFFVSRPKENPGAHARIAQKHVDFVLCHARTLKPALAVELDDSSHQKPERRERDQFVEGVFAAAGLRLVRVPARAGYQLPELRALLFPGVSQPPAEPEMPVQNAPVQNTPPSTSLPTVPEGAGAAECAKCGAPMLLRTSTRGERRGEQFLGCSNYPRCKNTAPAPAPS